MITRVITFDSYNLEMWAIKEWKRHELANRLDQLVSVKAIQLASGEEASRRSGQLLPPMCSILS
jgi:hypothetical protein